MLHRIAGVRIKRNAGAESNMVKCHTMAEVRREIDRIDRDLAKLLAERQGYIEQAGQIKGERGAVRDEARIEDVVQKALAAAAQHGLSPAIAEPVWRLLIEKSIEHEFAVFDAKTQKNAGFDAKTHKAGE